MLSSSVKGRDDNGYPLEGVDVVPERKGFTPGWKPFCREEEFHKDKIKYCTSRLVTLLKEANKRADQYKDQLDSLHRKYNALHDEYLALKYSDICDECQKVADSAIPGKTYSVCQACTGGRKTTESLKRELEKERGQVRYWQECYETALSQLTDIPDGKHDGRSDDGTSARV